MPGISTVTRNHHCLLKKAIFNCLKSTRSTRKSIFEELSPILKLNIIIEEEEKSFITVSINTGLASICCNYRGNVFWKGFRKKKLVED